VDSGRGCGFRIALAQRAGGRNGAFDAIVFDTE
jgi:hypothetical protein